MAEQRIAHWSSLGALVRAARAEHGLTQAVLAEKAGVSRAWLAKLESGHRSAEFELILRTLDALGLSLFARPTEYDDHDALLLQALAAQRGERERGSHG